ncbi:hypothetical protein MMC09_006504 [Bachmanniomyces sp. S44760]|nr:hypothetical protein [Bachmanniomyces sp. S44760]
MDASPTKTFHSKVYPAIEPTRPELSTKGKTVFITGGAAGVGLALTHSFAAAGATHIGIIGRRGELLAKTKKELEAEFPALTIFTRTADVLDQVAVNEAFSAFAASIGGGGEHKIDILIHNVGYLSHMAPIKSTEIGEWWKSFEINIKGSLIVAQGFLPHAAKDAKVVYLTTAVATLGPLPGGSAYASSKLGATKVFEYLQAENPDLRVISVHPGVLQTEMQDKLIDDGISMPQHEMSLPAGTVLWAASPEAEFMKGKILWANWDVTELKQREKEIESSNFLSLTLGGFPFAD